MFWKRRLKKLYEADQAPRQEYMTIVESYEGVWKLAKIIWIDKGHDPNDMFADFASGRSKKAKKLIRRHIRAILKNEDLTTYAWMLVQHSDDVKYQKWFLNKVDKNSDHYKYLYDRIAVNTNQPQKYQTQKLF